MSTPTEITCRRLLLVEGKDEVYFFEAYFETMGIIESIHIIDFAGKGNFTKKYINTLKLMPGFDNLISIGIVRDADNNAKSAFDSITGVMRECGFHCSSDPATFSTSSPQVGVYIMPRPHIDGMLEDLCLESEKEHPHMSLVNDFIEKLIERPNIPSKAKCLSFLASMKEMPNNVGLGAKKGYWNFEADCMSDLNVFMRTLAR